MRKPKLRVYHMSQPELTPQSQFDLRDVQEQYARAELAEMARKWLAWSTALVDGARYRLCPDGCGLVFMSRNNKGEHIDPAELIADWKDDKPEDADDYTEAPVVEADGKIPLRPAVSIAQVQWARDMVAQHPRKSQEQICRENGGISWEQIQHYAQSDTKGLPERKAQKALVNKAPVKEAEKTKADPKPKTKQAR